MPLLIITEKPSVATTIFQVLGQGAGERKDGYFVTKDYYITFLFGHLFTLKDAKEYDPKYGIWDVSNLPVIPEEFQYKLIDDAGVKKQFKIIMDLVRKPEITGIINAADSDREGELLAKEVIKAVKTEKPVKRLWVSSHTPEDLWAGFSSLRSDTTMKPLEQAGYARQWADWLTGINFTVATTKLFSQNKTVLKVGRVILPTVYLVYLRDMEIQNFKPRQYYELIATFESDAGVYSGTYIVDKETKFDNAKDLESVIRAVDGKPGTVISVQTKRVAKGPGKLFNLTDLQGFISSKYTGFTAEKVLKIAQSLYERQYISYPRTASRYLDDNQKDMARRVLDGVKVRFPELVFSFKESKSVFDSSKVDSHPALMPTYITPKDGALNPEEKTVYMAIVKRFCAQFAPAAVFDRTEAITGVAGYRFQTKGKVLVTPGWMALYGSNVEEDEDPDLKIQLKEKMPVKTIEVITAAKETKPPAHYTTQTLLEAMQNCGKKVTAEEEAEQNILAGYSIGTSSTRAEILKKIEQNGYVKLQSKSFYITPVGSSLIELFPIKEMLEPEFTGKLEKQLKDIERGEYSQEQFMEGIKEIICSGIGRMKEITGRVTSNQSDNIVGPCPLCHKGVIEHPKGYGCSGYKETGCRFFIGKHNALLEKYGMKEVPKKLVQKLLNNNLRASCQLKIHTVPVTLRQEGDFWNLRFDFQESEITSLGACPECGQPVAEFEKSYSCTGYKDGCKFGVFKENAFLAKFEIKVVPKMLVRMLLENGLKWEINIGARRVPVQLIKMDNRWGLQFEYAAGEIISLGPCPECGAPVVEREKGYGCSAFTGTGCSFFVFKQNAFLEKAGVKAISKTLMKNLLAKTHTVLPLRGKEIPVRLEKMDERWNLRFDTGESRRIVLGNCPECGREVVETTRGFSCSGYKETGCKFMIWKEDLNLKKFGKVVTAAMAKEVLSKRTIWIKGLVDPRNKAVFDANVRFGKNAKGYWNFTIIFK